MLESSVIYVVVGSIAVPMLAIIVFGFLSFPLFAIALAVQEPGALPRGDASAASAFVGFSIMIAVCGALVGTGVGLLLHGVRRPLIPSAAQIALGGPRMRTDALGGALAGALALAGYLLAERFGVWLDPVSQMMGADRVYPPPLLICLAIGLTAMLPHLVLLGLDAARKT